MSGHGVPHGVAETLAARGDECRERAQRGPLCGGGLEPAFHHDRHGDPPRQGMVPEEVTVPRLGGLGVLLERPVATYSREGSPKFFLVEDGGAEALP